MNFAESGEKFLNSKNMRRSKMDFITWEFESGFSH